MSTGVARITAPIGQAETLLASQSSPGFWREAWRRLRRRKLPMIALAFVAFLCLVAIFAPAIVGTKPIICKYKGSIYFPCLGYFNRSWENPIFFRDRFRDTLWREAADWLARH